MEDYATKKKTKCLRELLINHSVVLSKEEKVYTVTRPIYVM